MGKKKPKEQVIDGVLYTGFPEDLIKERLNQKARHEDSIEEVDEEVPGPRYPQRLKDGRYEPKLIYYLDSGSLTFESDKGQDAVALALSYVPAKIVDQVRDEARIIFTGEEQLGTVIPAEFIQNKAVILIDLGQLSAKPSMRIEGLRGIKDFMHKLLYLILHEVAHIHLAHLKDYKNRSYSEEELGQHEKEAQKLANKWLKNPPLYERESW